MTTNQPFRRLFPGAAATLAFTARRATTLTVTRAAMTLLVMMLMTATAWATNGSVSYIDGNGNSQNVDATVVTTDMGGTNFANFKGDYPWLYVKNSVTLEDGGYNNGFGTINIILGDGATLTVNKWLRFENASVNIYCQSGGTGKLVVNGSYEDAATFKINNTHTLTIYGGTVEVTNNAQYGNAFSGSSLVMNGGTATFNAPTSTKSYGIYANVAFNGGNLTATGWLGVQGDATLNHKATTDRISCSSYGGSVTIADGKYFKDSSGKVYAGTLTNDEKTSIASQTLQPATQIEYTVYCLLKNFSGTGTALDPYVISTTDAWDAFCNALDGDDTWRSYFYDKSWKLGKNITVSRMAGSGAGGNLTASDRPFCGTFDGGGNTLTFNYGSSGSPADENNLAPFRYVNNATIRHLHVSGDIYTRHAHAGGIVGMAYGTTNITDCRSSVNIHSSINGDGTHGGIMACSWTGSTTNIEGCLFDGSIQSASGYATDQCGGFVGWRNATINVTNSLLTADLTTIGAATGQQYPSATFVRNGEANRITNSYYTTTLGTAQGKQRRSITAGEYVTVENAGTATPYSTTGITAYPSGIGLTGEDGEVLYAGQGDQVSLTLGNTLPISHAFSHYKVSPDGTTLADNGNDYTLTMPSADVTIDVVFTYLLVPVSYVDADGTSKTADAFILDGTETTLASGWWYAVGSDITYTDPLTFDGDVNLILADGKTMTAEAGINGGSTLTIYGQQKGNGVLSATGKKGADGQNGSHSKPNGGVGETGSAGINGNVIIYGGTININGGAGGKGGNKYTKSSDGISGGLTVSGGMVTVNGGTGGTGGKGDGGKKGKSGTGGLGSKSSVTSSVATAIIQESNDKSTWRDLESGSSSELRYIRAGVPVALQLYDGESNTETIADNNGRFANVTLQGRTLYKDGAWNTLCLPFNVTLAGSELNGAVARPLTEASISGSTLNLTFGDAVSMLVAGTPYIIKWTKADDYVDDNAHNIVNPVFSGVTVSTAKHDYDNNASGDAKVRFLGTYDVMTFSGTDNSILLLGGANTLYYPGAGAGLGAQRAYFKIGEDAAQARRLTSFNIDFGDESTGITTTDFTDCTDSDDAWYDLQGRKLDGKPTARGIYVNGGRKVVIK